MLWYPDSFVYRDSIIGAVGPRAGALFFARHLDNFILTHNFRPLIGTLHHLDNFIMTRKVSPLNQDFTTLS
jgi:hypothetical protein